MVVAEKKKKNIPPFQVNWERGEPYAVMLDPIIG